MTHHDARRSSPYPWLAFGLLVLAAIYLLRETPTPAVEAVPAPTSTPGPDRVADALETANALHATEMAPPTSTAIPTAYPTAAATADVSLVWCSNVTPKAGQECQQDPAPEPTEAPRPACPTTPGRWCVWPDRDETSGEDETR